jgi:serine/threonine protein kinase
MQDYSEDLGLSRTFKLVNGRLSVADAFETLLNASGGRVPSKFSPRIVGTVIDGKYEVHSLLGEGGMGAVYKVRHLLLKKDMALKTFRTANLGADAWQRFQREAQAIAKLTHPNIVQVFDFGISEDNFPFYTMELLVGESLADRLQRKTRLHVSEALPIFSAVADGMAHAHRQGIIHRDIKPANIFMASTKSAGEPKIVDFGLAKLAASQSLEGQSLTTAGLIFGSPLYMSPEQAKGLDTDQRTDLYSFGCSLFQALTGRPPFAGESALATIMMHQVDAPPHLVQVANDTRFPERLEAIVAKLLEKNCEKRYQTFEALGRELAAIDLSSLTEPEAFYGGTEFGAESAGPGHKRSAANAPGSDGLRTLAPGYAGSRHLKPADERLSGAAENPAARPAGDEADADTIAGEELLRAQKAAGTGRLLAVSAVICLLIGIVVVGGLSLVLPGKPVQKRDALETSAPSSELALSPEELERAEVVKLGQSAWQKLDVPPS